MDHPVLVRGVEVRGVADFEVVDLSVVLEVDSALENVEKLLPLVCHRAPLRVVAR